MSSSSSSVLPRLDNTTGGGTGGVVSKSSAFASFVSVVFSPILRFLRNENFQAILGGVVGFWGGIFGMAIIFAVVFSVRRYLKRPPEESHSSSKVERDGEGQEGDEEEEVVVVEVDTTETKRLKKPTKKKPTTANADDNDAKENPRPNADHHHLPEASSSVVVEKNELSKVNEPKKAKKTATERAEKKAH